MVIAVILIFFWPFWQFFRWDLKGKVRRGKIVRAKKLLGKNDIGKKKSRTHENVVKIPSLFNVIQNSSSQILRRFVLGSTRTYLFFPFQVHFYNLTSWSHLNHRLITNSIKNPVAEISQILSVWHWIFITFHQKSSEIRWNQWKTTGNSAGISRFSFNDFHSKFFSVLSYIPHPENFKFLSKRSKLNLIVILSRILLINRRLSANGKRAVCSKTASPQR